MQMSRGSTIQKIWSLEQLTACQISIFYCGLINLKILRKRYKNMTLNFIFIFFNKRNYELLIVSLNSKVYDVNQKPFQNGYTL